MCMAAVSQFKLGVPAHNFIAHPVLVRFGVTYTA